LWGGQQGPAHRQLFLPVAVGKESKMADVNKAGRRCAQFQIEFSRSNILAQPAVDATMEEMLFTGGALNRRLLGGEGIEQTAD
jgi:hypothetical protein